MNTSVGGNRKINAGNIEKIIGRMMPCMTNFPFNSYFEGAIGNIQIDA